MIFEGGSAAPSSQCEYPKDVSFIAVLLNKFRVDEVEVRYEECDNIAPTSISSRGVCPGCGEKCDLYLYSQQLIGVPYGPDNREELRVLSTTDLHLCFDCIDELENKGLVFRKSRNRSPNTTSFIRTTLNRLHEEKVSVSYMGFAKSGEGVLTDKCPGCEEEAPLYLYGRQVIQMPGEPVSKQEEQRIKQAGESHSWLGQTEDGRWRKARVLATVDFHLCSGCFDTLEAERPSGTWL